MIEDFGRAMEVNKEWLGSENDPSFVLKYMGSVEEAVSQITIEMGVSKPVSEVFSQKSAMQMLADGAMDFHNLPQMEDDDSDEEDAVCMDMESLRKKAMMNF